MDLQSLPPEIYLYQRIIVSLLGALGILLGVLAKLLWGHIKRTAGEQKFAMDQLDEKQTKGMKSLEYRQVKMVKAIFAMAGALDPAKAERLQEALATLINGSNEFPA